MLSTRTENIKYIRTDTISANVITMTDKFEKALTGQAMMVKYAMCWDILRETLEELKLQKGCEKKSEFVLGLMRIVEDGVEGL